MKVTASALRADIYKLLDRVLETGVPIVVDRKGKQLKIVPVGAPSKLSRLISRPDYLRDDPESFIHIDWSAEWKP